MPVPQPRERDGNGQFVSFGALFERERREHAEDHQRESLAAAASVKEALAQVDKTAVLHAVAHKEQHDAHERIHKVEKEQRDKEDTTAQRDSDKLAAALAEYKETSNEWRGALRDQGVNYVTRPQFDRVVEDLKVVQTFQVAHPGVTSEVLQQALTNRDERLSSLDQRFERTSAEFVTRQQFDTEHERLIAIEKRMAYYAGAAAAAGATIALIIRLLGVGH